MLTCYSFVYVAVVGPPNTYKHLFLKTQSEAYNIVYDHFKDGVKTKLSDNKFLKSFSRF